VTVAVDGLEVTSARRPRVLVVDDQDAIREAMAEMLIELGMAVVGTARDGGQAVDLADTSEADVVLMDLRMPGVDGLEATRLIKERRPLTQIIIYSAYDDPALQRGADEVGAFCYLVKGCRPQLVYEMLGMAWAHAAGQQGGSPGDQSLG
jgi:DNA-binding NarL/FixJ family response regulator